MMKHIFLLLLLYSQLFSCALCSMYTPSAHVKIKLDMNETRLHHADVTWRYTEKFLQKIGPQYDKDGDNKYNASEVEMIEQTLVDYIYPLDYLTTIKYYPKDLNGTFEDVVKNEIKVKHYKTYVENGELHFSYRLILDYPLKKEMILFVIVEDKGNFMNFMTDADNMYFSAPHGYKIIENANYNMVFFDFEDASFVLEEPSLPLKKPEANSSQEKVQITQEAEQNPVLAFLSAKLAQTTAKIREYLQEIKNNQSSYAFFALMLFSFVYGVVHALGPGHGKALVSSYFLSTQRDIQKAFYISAAIGVVHTFSALILTLLVYFTLNVLLSSFIENVTFYLTKISAIIILIMVSYLLYKKLPKPANKKWDIHVPTCGCSSCQADHKKADIGVVLGAGMIPCPTTVLLFIFTFAQGMYLTGFIAALFMSAGMSLVIFIAAALSLKVREKSEENFTKLSSVLGFTGIGIIMILALMMLFS